MSDGGLQVLDGTQLSNVDFTVPETTGDATVARARVLEIAESRASDCLYGLALPENLKSSALHRLNFVCQPQELDKDQAQLLLRGYLTAIADELRDDPLVVSVLDGNIIRLFLEDEDDFAMLAENLFTDLDSKDDGKLSKSQIESALAHMAVEMGVPPLSEFPVIKDILKKHGAVGEEKLGQAQFAQLLQPILQELADALALKPVTVLQNVKIINGSKLRKLLADDNQFNGVVEKIYRQRNDHPKEQNCKGVIRGYLEKNGEELGLPPIETNEAVILLYDTIFSEIDEENKAIELEKKEFGLLLKQILQNFAENLQANPVFHEGVN